MENRTRITIADIGAEGQTAGYVLTVTSAGNIIASGITQGSVTFLDLTDTPSSYSGNASKFIRVNTAGDALEFTETTSSGINVKESGTLKVQGATTLNFIGATVSGGGENTADITISGGGGGGPGESDFTIWMPEAPPASPSSYDDEFDDASFDTSLWTEWDVSSTLTVNEAEHGLYFTGGTVNDGQGIFIDITDQDFVIYTYVGALNASTGDDIGGLLILEDTANLSTSDAVIWGIYRGGSVGLRAAWLNQYNSWNSTLSNRTTGPGGYEPGYFLRLRQSGTTWYFGYSIDGYHWMDVDNVTRKWAVDGIGLGQRKNTTNNSNLFHFKFFRFSTNDGVDDMLYGDRVKFWRA